MGETALAGAACFWVSDRCDDVTKRSFPKATFVASNDAMGNHPCFRELNRRSDSNLREGLSHLNPQLCET